MRHRTTVTMVGMGALAAGACFLLNSCSPPKDTVQDPVPISLRFTPPGPGEKLECKLGIDGGNIKIGGTWRGIDVRTRMPLLFVYPQDPGVFGWFLQIDPHGVELNLDGTWNALGQVGNHDYPPRSGMKINLMIRAVPLEEANKLINARKQDKKLRNTAIRTQDLPDVKPQCVAELKDVELDVR